MSYDRTDSLIIRKLEEDPSRALPHIKQELSQLAFVYVSFSKLVHIFCRPVLTLSFCVAHTR